MIIGILDSGLGAINVLNYLIKQNKKATYILYLDYKNNPYGEKTKDELIEYYKIGITFLSKKKCDKIIIACNTMSIIASYFSYEVITPIFFINDEIKKIKKENFIILSTKFTKNSNVYKGKSISCKDIVEHIERNKHLNKIKYKCIFKKYDCIILACTHYGLLFKEICNKKIIDSAKILANNISVNDDNLNIHIYSTLINFQNYSKIKEYLITKYFSLNLIDY